MILMFLVYVMTINSVFGLYLYFSLIFIIVIIIVNGTYNCISFPNRSVNFLGTVFVFTSLCSLVPRIQPQGLEYH